MSDSGGSRISRWGGGGGGRRAVGGHRPLKRALFGGRTGSAPLDPPMCPQITGFTELVVYITNMTGLIRQRFTETEFQENCTSTSVSITFIAVILMLLVQMRITQGYDVY